MISTHDGSQKSAHSADNALRAGRRVFNRYVLQRVVGRGGMGVVWLARDEKLDRPVALKFLPEMFLMDATARDGLKRETRHSLDLTHPHIVRIHDFVEDEEMAAIAMEYVDGPTLSALRVEQPSRCFDPEALAVWTGALCAALDYAHESGRCVHRDLKPGNLMVTARGVLKVADFGIACSLQNTAARMSAWSSTGGTLGYMSPQQLMGELTAPSDDIYSVGATLYELLTGTLPFFGGDLALQIREVIPDTVTQRRLKFGLPGILIPKAWEETIAACLAKQPRDRPSSAGEIARRLGLVVAPLGETAASLGEGAALTVSSAPTSVVRLPKWRRMLDRVRGFPLMRFRWPIITAFALGAAVVPWIWEPYAIARMQEASRQSRPRPHRAAVPLAESPVTPAPDAPPSSEPVATDDQLALRSPIPAPSLAAAAALVPVEPPQIQIDTVPSGIPFKVLASAYESPLAEVLRSGETPAVLQDLPPGSYRVILSPRGSAPKAASVQMPADGTAIFHQEFPHGVIKVRSVPDGATVVCDGREIGPTPLELPVSPGRHEIGARWNGRDARERPIQVSDAAEQTVSFDFRSSSGSTKSKSRHSKKAEDESMITKVGRSLKTFFTGDAGKKR